MKYAMALCNKGKQNKIKIKNMAYNSDIQYNEALHVLPFLTS